MKNKLSILIYEQEKHLNSILYQQISDTTYFKPFSVNEHETFSELVHKRKFDILILNLEDINYISNNFIDDILNQNHHSDIIGYCNKSFNKSNINNLNITLIEKPFRFRTLLEKLEYIKLTKNKNNKIILIKHIEYLPNKKTLFNSRTNVTIHLTEKENYLLKYLYNKRNVELTKHDLLIKIWGVNEGINTHTLETHIYRLKQKLFKLEPNLSFSLINNNGLYSIKYN